MELVLHIGLSKTGTSAIQNFLWRKKQLLYKKFRVLYPTTGIFSESGVYAHYNIAWSIYKPEEVCVYNIPTLEKIATSLHEEILRYNDIKQLIISSESFMHIKDEESYSNLNKLIHNFNFAKVKILVYLRRQDIWQESSWIQVLKTMIIKTTPFRYSCRYSVYHLDWLLRYDYLLKRWHSAFPEAQIIPRIYDRNLFPHGNVILDFLSILGIQIPEEEARVEANPSISHLSALALSRINEIYDLPEDIHIKLVKALLEIDSKEKSPLKSFFTLKERMEFLEHFRESNEKLFKEWFNSENRFVLSEEEIEFYKEQDEILKDKDYLERLIKERYEKAVELLSERGIDMNSYRRENVARVHISKEPDIYGYVDVLNLQKICGWVLDLEENKPTQIEVRINGIKVLEKDANIYRPDVSGSYGIDFPTGFEVYMKEIVLPNEIKELPDETECRVEVYHKRTGKLIQGNYRGITVKEIKKSTRLSKDFPYVRYVMEERVKEFVEFANLDQLYIDVLNDGKLIFGGLVVIKKEFDQSEFKLVIKDAEGEKEVQWFLPSPGYAKNSPDNPNAKKARYRAERVVVEPNITAGLFLVKGGDRSKLLEAAL